MHTRAIILEAPERLDVRLTALREVLAGDVVVDVRWSGISSGTEKLLWNGEMPSFPGMGYPLVPGYESIGQIVDAGADCEARIGEWVFVPGADCYREARGLFGGNAQRLIVPSVRALPVPERLGASGVLIALAATAQHALAHGEAPQLIVGHGVLGRLMARLVIASGAPAPIVWENSEARMAGAQGYAVIHPEADDRRDYQAVCDLSGDPAVLDSLVGRIAKGGEIVLAGFYRARLGFDFAPAFQREARIRIAAEWQPDDLKTTLALIETGALDLSGLITDVAPARDAAEAYPHAFEAADCLKMVLDWSQAE